MDEKRKKYEQQDRLYLEPPVTGLCKTCMEGPKGQGHGPAVPTVNEHKKKRYAKKDTQPPKTNGSGIRNRAVGGDQDKRRNGGEEVMKHGGLFSLSLGSGGFVVTISFAVNAPAVGLAIHTPLPGYLNTFLPTLPEIPVQKGKACFFSYGLSDLADEGMVLETAVEKGGGKGVELSPFGQQGSGAETFMVADSATIRLPENHIL
jgi:hypothetical protein